MKKITLILLLGMALACNNADKPAMKEDHSKHNMASQNLDGYADSVNAGLITEDTLKGSPHRVVMKNIAGSHVHVEYGSPGVKGRIIWGGLIPFDQVWVTGAHSATRISFSQDVLWGGSPVPAGTYAFFTIPGKEEWTVILNKNFEQHLADEYSEQEDLLRIKVKPTTLTEQVPRLTYSLEADGPKSGELIVAWEKIAIHIPIKRKG
ncbi:MAG: DUF2911 domain-containing protein [Chitinophagaceae bacterium]|nr:DUF2911 domain-containing protein [Chitinophagaceae bacterium]